MTKWEVVFGRGVFASVAVAEAWWGANREAAPTLFREEFEAAVAKLERAPETFGTPVKGRPTMRALRMAKTRYLVLYKVLPLARMVVVVLVRHGSRRPLTR